MSLCGKDKLGIKNPDQTCTLLHCIIYNICKAYFNAVPRTHRDSENQNCVNLLPYKMHPCLFLFRVSITPIYSLNESSAQV